MNTIDYVWQFHKRFGLPTESTPCLPPYKRRLLRLHLIQEELAELAHAFAEEDLVKVLDALTDLQVVLDGTYIECGMDSLKKAAFMEVHRSNMSKLGVDGNPLLNEAGRVVKGPNYRPPNLAPLLGAGPTLKVGDQIRFLVDQPDGAPVCKDAVGTVVEVGAEGIWYTSNGDGDFLASWRDEGRTWERA